MLRLIATRLKLAPEGALIAFSALLIALLSLALGFRVPGFALLLVAFAVASFFRDPDRYPPEHQGVIVSAADGKVVEITRRKLAAAGDELWQQVSVFMSPLNVHINRAPVSGEVARIEHTPG